MKFGVKTSLCLLGAALGAWLAARPAAGTMIVAEETWNAPGTANWTDDEAWVTLGNPMTGGSDGSGYLRITLDQASAPGNEPYALPHVDATTLFAGNWKGVQISFNFWAEEVAPESVQVRWGSSSNSTVWSSTVYDSGSSTMATQQWTRLVAPALNDYMDWDQGSGSQQTFISDLAGIDWIGVYISRNGDQMQNYGMDEFRLTVPEPSEYVMLAAALATSVMSLRRRFARRGAGEV